MRKPFEFGTAGATAVYDLGAKPLRGILMLKSLIFIVIACAVALPAFCEPAAKYELATILDVKPHQSAGDSSSSVGARYDISIKAAGTIYLVLYTDTLGTSTA